MQASREQVIAYRVAAQQLDRSAKTVRSLAVLDIGVQDAAGDAARLAFDARLASTPRLDVFGPDASLALMWSLRGAPYVHRRTDLGKLARALYPLSEADATQRLSETGPSVQRAGIDALEQFAIAASTLRKVVTRPTPKGEASTAVTKAIPEAMRRAVPHVQDQPHLRRGDARGGARRRARTPAGDVAAGVAALRVEQARGQA